MHEGDFFARNPTCNFPLHGRAAKVELIAIAHVHGDATP